MNLKERAEGLRNILKRLHENENPEVLKKEFKEKFGNVTSEEIAEAENELVKEGINPDSIKDLCDIHASIFEGGITIMKKTSSNDLDDTDLEGHPLMIFRQENNELSKFIDEKILPLITASNEGKANKNELLEALYNLKKIDKHYSIKENLFFPYLEKNGITAPPKVMWGVDDEIRAKLKNVIEGVEDTGALNEASLKEVIEDIKSMIKKENDILTPMLKSNIKGEDWITIAKEIPEIGYSFAQGVEGASPSDAKNWIRKFSKEEIDENRVHSEESGKTNINEELKEGKITLPSGFFTINELESILNTLPGDITFVGKDGTVHYFSEGKERVFPRTRTIIGRKVEDCHPPKSLDKVESLIEDFKSGKKDREDFWIQRMDKFILIRYFAVRDKNGEYLGVMEVTEEISKLRSLEGDKTLAD